MPVSKGSVLFGLGALLILLGPARVWPQTPHAENGGDKQRGWGLEVPSWLARYDLDIHLHPDQHQAVVRERVTWTNRHNCQVSEIQFNVHSSFAIPKNDVGFLAKMEELLRIAPSEGMDFEGHACQIHKVTVVSQDARL